MKNSRIKQMATISMCVAIIAVSALLTIPFAVNFTLQTFAIFVICALFNLKTCFLSVLIYILLGMCGLPIFSGFTAGLAALSGPTGGYLLSFLLIPPIMYLFLRNNKSVLFKILAMLISLAFCYLLGTAWYYYGFASHTDMTFLGAVTVCVIPFVIPDILKIILAAAISGRLERYIINNSGGNI